MIRTATAPRTRAHHDTFNPLLVGGGSGLLARRSMVFFDKDPDVRDMTEVQFRTAVLDGVKEAKVDLGKTINEHKELKNLCETTFAEYKATGATMTELAKKFVAIEKAALDANAATRRGLPAHERIREHEETLKAIGEACKKRAHFGIVMKAEGEDTTATGGNLVNPNLTSDVYALELDYGAAKMLDYRTLGTKQEKMLVETTEPDAVFVAENGVIPEQALAIDQTLISSRKIAALLGISMELLDDSVIDLGAYVLRKFARGNARRTDFVAFQGTGANDAFNGGFTGLFNSGTAVFAKAGHTQVELYDYLDFLACLTAVDPAVLENPEACWMAHPTSIVRALGVRDGNGRPIFLNALEAPTASGIGSILGFPVKMVSMSPNSNAPGKPMFAFGDPKAYTVGNRKEYQFDLSDHARFDSAQRLYRGMSRKAFGMRQARALVVLNNAAQ